MKMKTVDVTNSRQLVGGFFEELGIVRRPIEIIVGGRRVARLMPPTELSEAEKAKIVQTGWKAVQKARGRTRGTPAREIGRIVDAAVRRVRSQT